jgi:hypothetical protein
VQRGQPDPEAIQRQWFTLLEPPADADHPGPIAISTGVARVDAAGIHLTSEVASVKRKQRLAVVRHPEDAGEGTWAFGIEYRFPQSLGR